MSASDGEEREVESGGKGTMLTAADSWGMGLSSEFGLKKLRP